MRVPYFRKLPCTARCKHRKIIVPVRNNATTILNDESIRVLVYYPHRSNYSGTFGQRQQVFRLQPSVDRGNR